MGYNLPSKTLRSWWTRVRNWVISTDNDNNRLYFRNSPIHYFSTLKELKIVGKGLQGYIKCLIILFNFLYFSYYMFFGALRIFYGHPIISCFEVWWSFYKVWCSSIHHTVIWSSMKLGGYPLKFGVHTEFGNHFI